MDKDKVKFQKLLTALAANLVFSLLFHTPSTKATMGENTCDSLLEYIPVCSCFVRLR